MLSLTPRGVRHKLISNCTYGKKQNTLTVLDLCIKSAFASVPILTAVAHERPVITEQMESTLMTNLTKCLETWAQTMTQKIGGNRGIQWETMEEWIVTG